MMPRITALIFLFAVCVAIVILQVFLSKRESRWAGLVLPFVSMGIALLAFLGILMSMAHTSTTMVMIDGELVEQTTVIASTASIIASAVYAFVIYNIPTAVLLAIYAGCRSGRNKQRALEKMSAQDLE